MTVFEASETNQPVEAVIVLQGKIRTRQVGSKTWCRLKQGGRTFTFPMESLIALTPKPASPRGRR